MNEDTILTIENTDKTLKCNAVKSFDFNSVKIAAILNLISDHMALNIEDKDKRKAFEDEVIEIYTKMVEERYTTGAIKSEVEQSNE